MESNSVADNIPYYLLYFKDKQLWSFNMDNEKSIYSFQHWDTPDCKKTIYWSDIVISSRKTIANNSLNGKYFL